ncbi:MAG: hypothetical protein SVK08_11105 [Halobacteriota archaeon]|nr:hypothetical protein [Halobacteriota archaeon]
MKVDSRYNFMMTGFAIALIAVASPPIPMLIFIIALSIMISHYMSRVMAKGDIEAIRWILLGTLLINPFATIVFLVSLTCLIAVAFLTNMALYRERYSRKIRTPGMPLILGAFIIAMAISMG